MARAAARARASATRSTPPSSRSARPAASSPRLDAELLLAHVLGVDRAALITDPERGLEPDEARAFMDLAARRREREPVAYLLGSKGFRTIDLAVDARVLVPRPETEHVVEAALDAAAPARGWPTSAPARGRSRWRSRPSGPTSRWWPRRLSPGALAVARANAARLGLDARSSRATCWIRSTARWTPSSRTRPTSRRATCCRARASGHEPREALFGGEDGLTSIRRLIPAAAGVPFLAIEVGAGQARRGGGDGPAGRVARCRRCGPDLGRHRAGRGRPDPQAASPAAGG